MASGEFRFNSDNFGDAIGAEVNLLLVGHTHGGQIGISFLTEKSKSTNKSSFMSGLFDAGKTKMYVNRGIGTMHVPIRFFNRPEITVLTIRKWTQMKTPKPLTAIFLNKAK